MHKTKHQHTNSVSSKRPRLECSSKHVKRKNKHSRTKSELIGSQNAVKYDNSPPDPFTSNDNAFGMNMGARRGVRMPNVNLERTLDFIGMGSSNQQNNNVFGLNASNSNISGLFRTLNNSSNQINNNFASAAEAMGGELGVGLQRSSSIFTRPFGQSNSFHNRHNSVTYSKRHGRHFETEIDDHLEGLEENKISSGKTFDERHAPANFSIYNSYDVGGNQRDRRTNSMSFNFGGGSFHFRRTISRVPAFMERKKLSRQLSIQK